MPVPANHAGQACINCIAISPKVFTHIRFQNNRRSLDILLHPADTGIILRQVHGRVVLEIGGVLHVIHAIQCKRGGIADAIGDLICAGQYREKCSGKEQQAKHYLPDNTVVGMPLLYNVRNQFVKEERRAKGKERPSLQVEFKDGVHAPDIPANGNQFNHQGQTQPSQRYQNNQPGAFVVIGPEE